MSPHKKDKINNGAGDAETKGGKKSWDKTTLLHQKKKQASSRRTKLECTKSNVIYERRILKVYIRQEGRPFIGGAVLEVCGAEWGHGKARKNWLAARRGNVFSRVLKQKRSSWIPPIESLKRNLQSRLFGVNWRRTSCVLKRRRIETFS